MSEFTKHPRYSDELIKPTEDIFNPEFKRDSKGSYFMQLPGYGKWKVSVEPGSKIISQGSEDERGYPATDPASIRTGYLHAETQIRIGDNIVLDAASGCIFVGDFENKIGSWMALCGDSFRGYNGKDMTFAYFLEKDGDFGPGDVFIGDITSENFVLWDDSDGKLYVKGEIVATSGFIGGWEIDTCLKSEFMISPPSRSKIELCPGNPGHVQVAYSPSGVFSIPGDVDMVQITQGSTLDPGGIPVPRVDIYRGSTKRAMLNSNGLFFFQPDGITIATAIYSGATNEEYLTNINATAGQLAGAIALNNAQTIDSVTSHVISTGNSHQADIDELIDAQLYMGRIDDSILWDVVDGRAYYIRDLWTKRIATTSSEKTGIIMDHAGIRGYDGSFGLRFELNADNGNFYFGNYPSGNSVAWNTLSGQLVVRGEIRALSGYIGGDTSGWFIGSNVMQAWSGAGGTGTKLIELSTTGPHIQCLLNSSNYVQMTPASNDPRFDVFSGGVRRARFNRDGLTFWNSTGTQVTSNFNFGTNLLEFYSSGVLRASIRGTVGAYGGIYCSGDVYIPNNRAFWISNTGSGYGGMGLTSGNSLWMTCGSANTFYVFNTAQNSQMLGISTLATVIGGPSYSSMRLIPYSNRVANLGDQTHQWLNVYCRTIGSSITGDPSGNTIFFSQAGRVQVDNHFDPSGLGTKNSGGPSRYWNYITCNDINKISGGGLGWLWLDDGVELPDGKKVSDVEAIRQLKLEEQTDKYGNKVKVIDKRSLPKILLRKAEDHDGNLFPRDEKDEPYTIDDDNNKIPLKDTESVFNMISLLVGCIRELDSEITNLKKQPNN